MVAQHDHWVFWVVLVDGSLVILPREIHLHGVIYLSWTPSAKQRVADTVG